MLLFFIEVSIGVGMVGDSGLWLLNCRLIFSVIISE